METVNTLISTIIGVCDDRYCRLCLQQIQEKYVLLGDLVNKIVADETAMPITETLSKVLGLEIENKKSEKCEVDLTTRVPYKFLKGKVFFSFLIASEEIPGINAICTKCFDSTIDFIKFFDQVKQSTLKLNKLLDNLTQSLKVYFGPSLDNQKLYVYVNGFDNTFCVIEQEMIDGAEQNERNSEIDVQTEEAKEVIDKIESNDDTVEMELQQEHIESKEDLKKLYKCEKCDKPYKSITGLKKHSNTHSIITCSICQEAFYDKDKMKLHITHKHDNIFNCPDCDHFCSSQPELSVHQVKVHREYICKVCRTVCLGTVRLTAHEAAHRNSQDCLECGKKHKSKFKCLDCDQVRCTEEANLKHQEESHCKYICEVCGTSCHGFNNLKAHEETHRSKECPKCGKKYNTKEFFLRHKKLCLEGLLDPHPIRSQLEQKFSCEKCGKGFVSNGGLRVHNRFVHGNAKPHVCSYCNKKFTAPSCLKSHMIKHTRERNFECKLCGNKLVSKEALVYHMRRHTGEKPYSCKYCDMMFVNASTRAEHIKSKHMEPQFACEYCERKFVSRPYYEKHVNKHRDPRSKLFQFAAIRNENVSVDYLNDSRKY